MTRTAGTVARARLRTGYSSREMPSAAEQLRNRALTARYTVPQAAALVDRPPETVRRWAFGHDRRYQGEPVHDLPLINADGEIGAGPSLSFTNLLELQMLSRYRGDVPLQAIRRALEFAAEAMKATRPLLEVRFKAIGRDLFTQFAATPDGQALLVNASKGGQLVLREFTAVVDAATADVDYPSDVATVWWYRGRAKPVVVDTRVAAGHPITAETAVRVSAIRSRAQQGLSRHDIRQDTGASAAEVDAALLIAA